MAPEPGQRSAWIALAAIAVLIVILVRLVAVLLTRHAADVFGEVDKLARRAPVARLPLPATPAPQPTAPPVIGVLATPVAVPPMPKGNIADWFSNDYYPPEAKSRGIQGRVQVSLRVDARGVPVGCSVRLSSNDANLDRTTCNLAYRFGRFAPARDAQGNATPGDFLLPPVRWQIQDE